MSDNFKVFFNKASEDNILKNRIINIYREYNNKEEIIEQLMLLASEYNIILSHDDFIKQSESDDGYEKRNDFGCPVIENTASVQETQETVKDKSTVQKRSFFGKLLIRK